jgi:hypothetical protein
MLTTSVQEATQHVLQCLHPLEPANTNEFTVRTYLPPTLTKGNAIINSSCPTSFIHPAKFTKRHIELIIQIFTLQAMKRAVMYTALLKLMKSITYAKESVTCILPNYYFKMELKECYYSKDYLIAELSF